MVSKKSINKKLIKKNEVIEATTMPKPKAISLFAGMGGDSLGMKQAGFDVIAFNEISKPAIESHRLNFEECELIVDDTPFVPTAEAEDESKEQTKAREKDDKKRLKEKEKNATNIQCIPDEVFARFKGKVDLVFAGHPCQGFSNGGKKLPDDPRNTLFREFARVCKLSEPRYIIGENVDGLLSRKTADGRNYIDVIVEEFDSIGYNVKYQVCHTVRFGVPQLRKRLVYVGVRKDLQQTYEFPEELNDGKVLAGAGNLPNLQNIVGFSMEGAIKIDPDDFDMSTIPSECIMTDLTNDDGEDEENIHPYLRLKANSKDVEYDGKTHHSLLSFSKRDSPIHCEIIDVRNPSKTIICTYDHQPRLFVPLRNKNGYYLRCLLPDELKQIQGFPADFQIAGNKKDKIKQVGNAVPPPLITLIAKQLLTMSGAYAE
tara:strand:- start:1093 stop:2379 length:1287 start_codon:yes stop_codon:yes gene_type:complete